MPDLYRERQKLLWVKIRSDAEAARWIATTPAEDVVWTERGLYLLTDERRTVRHLPFDRVTND